MVAHLSNILSKGILPGRGSEFLRPHFLVPPELEPGPDQPQPALRIQIQNPVHLCKVQRLCKVTFGIHCRARQVAMSYDQRCSVIVQQILGRGIFLPNDARTEEFGPSHTVQGHFVRETQRPDAKLYRHA